MIRAKHWVGLLVVVGLAAGCAVMPVTPPAPPDFGDKPAVPGTDGPVGVSVALIGATTTPRPATAVVTEGINATLADTGGAIGSDPTGMKTAAYLTLQNFDDPNGPYSGSWWFLNDGRADISELLAVILYTEGNTSWDVRTAVTARYLWYCAGTGSGCQGHALIDFLSYFQAWRKPWNAPGFTSDSSQQYASFAQDLVNQRPGLLTAMIPGADTYVRSNDGLSLSGPIDWANTSFHFANVDSTWDGYLRGELRRPPNGPNHLWVLTMGEAGLVCGSEFVCADMTRPR
jgi:hypothetical protein